MTTAAETYTQINSLISSLSEKAAPYAERFLNYITNNPAYGYLDFHLPEGEQLPFASYSMEVGAEVNNESNKALFPGIFYRGEYWDYDDRISVGFCMPFAYMEDADKWEVDFALRVRKEREAALNALNTLAPGLIDGKEDIIDIESAAYMQEPGLLVLDLTHITGKWEDNFVYNGKKYRGFYSWFFNPATNEIFYVPYSDMVVIMNGEVPALTPEELK